MIDQVVAKLATKAVTKQGCGGPHGIELQAGTAGVKVGYHATHWGATAGVNTHGQASVVGQVCFNF